MESWNSRRSAVFSTRGMVACTQPLAAAIGIKVLNDGGTAADAGVAVAAALNVLEPCSTGIGGDAFVLYYEAASKSVSCLMGNGQSSSELTVEKLSDLGYGIKEGKKKWDSHSGLCVTVPGACLLWENLTLKHGRRTLAQNLLPAIDLAEKGFVVGPVTALQWGKGFLQGEEAIKVFRPNGTKGPEVGELFYNRDLAQTFREVSEKGAKEGFYSGRIAEAIVKACHDYEGVLSLTDLANHETHFVEPISTSYKGYRVYETPPPTHGLAALMGLNLMLRLEEDYQAELSNTPRESLINTHLSIEALRLAFSDTLQYNCDPLVTYCPLEVLLSERYAAQRVKLLNPAQSVSIDPSNVEAYSSSETVYFCIVDEEGNGCSMINSNYEGFGTGIVPDNCGFTLQNRGYNFSLDPSHPNCVAPSKRPYHTIIPSLITRESDGSLFATLGVMGGFMQPQGHFQVIRNMIDYQMNAQEALDAPRWMIQGLQNDQEMCNFQLSKVALEDGYGYGEGHGHGSQGGISSLKEELESVGHNITIMSGNARTCFGRGQIITRNSDTGVLCGGSDPRADGCAIPQF